ncbi:5-formyltetrahydrofolate cyclo-ligase [Skermanella sp. TT6]|uniref:5-formyltetrahydrofolate cyclo-ligase n=1 Tax=Skermanella cutis TaxID=2775420 RepID=A0ABX7AZH5_9PROT|nr:5-formyltetrahydrofolate cyclo-ligase [Skermanella sp. TT6]QQP87490.1 5-formyltetrahydrofolate cyclo-ligase [Skermanella sp. TT6]
MTDPADLRDLKNATRASAKALRAEAAAAAGAEASEAVSRRVAGLLAGMPRPAVVAGYWPIGSEFDVRPVLSRLDLDGFTCALPVVAARGEPLLFRRWTPQVPMERTGLGILAPAAGEPEVEPDALLVPLLAFDRAGFRLGYGAGFYDRTLERLRRIKPVTAIGIGFAAQEVETVPRDRYDEPLDWIVTETSALRISD